MRNVAVVTCDEPSLVLNDSYVVHDETKGTVLADYSTVLILAPTPWSTPTYNHACTVGDKLYATFSVEVETPDGTVIAPKKPIQTRKLADRDLALDPRPLCFRSRSRGLDFIAAAPPDACLEPRQPGSTTPAVIGPTFCTRHADESGLVNRMRAVGQVARPHLVMPGAAELCGQRRWRRSGALRNRLPAAFRCPARV